MSILRVKDHLIHLTMSNNTTIIYTKEKNLSVYIVAYYAFSLIIVGTIFNLLTFIVLCRKKFRDTNERPALHYMRAMAIFDSLMLYGWNLDHYTFTVYGFELIVYTIASCKYVGFFNYFTRQVSAWLRVFISFDRFLSLKYHYRTWFGRSKNVLIIIGSIIGVGTLFNLHIVIFACFYEPNGTMNVNSRLSMMYPYPIWTYVHLGISNFLPFVLMGIFNANAIYHLMNLRRTSSRLSYPTLRYIKYTYYYAMFVLNYDYTSNSCFWIFWGCRRIYCSLYIRFNVIHLSYLIICNLYNYMGRISARIHSNNYTKLQRS